MADLAGKVIDKYKLVRLIGQGGMGAVYEARHTLVKKKCAVKLLHSDLSENNEMVRRMLREAQAAAAIGHPNIVETLDFGATSENICYLVMEYLEGESLGDVLKRKGILELEEAVAVLIQVLQALEAAHDVGIVHRDLKPDNIFIAKGRRGEREIKILDFGISKILVGEESNTNLTKTGAIMGTPHYMSPEQAEGAERVTAQTDLWAVGVMLFQMLTGKLPFDGNNYNRIITKIVIEPPPPLRSLRPDLSEELEGILLKAMSRKPEERFLNAAAFVAALDPFRDIQEVGQTDWSGEHRLLDERALAKGPEFGAKLGVGLGVTDRVAPVSTPGITSASASAPSHQESKGREGALSGGWAKAERRGAGGGEQNPTIISPGEVMGRESFVSERVSRIKIGTLVGGGAFAAVVVVLFFSLGGEKGPKGDGSTNGIDRVFEKSVVGGDGVSAGDVKSNGLENFRGISPPVEHQIVEIRLEGLPKGAEVYVDDKLEEYPLQIDVDEKERVLKVKAEGYETFRKPFVARKGVDPIRVSMKKVIGKRFRTGKTRRIREPKDKKHKTKVTDNGIFTSPF